MKYKKPMKIVTILIIVVFLLATFLGGIVPFLTGSEEQENNMPAESIEMTTPEIESIGDADMIVNPFEEEGLDTVLPEAEVTSPAVE